MAITYKSQGAGVATEASGGALSPLCPATVDAGDILIAHVGWEGTTTAPSTPGGWTLLSGPHTIESAHRHWIFGKIADGTEDGAAVAFGSPAVTTMRTARVYSFGGRVAGTIDELVNNFAHISHATDPQMPTVTTEIAGALAVACVFQLDDNATASATGESGGDWVEAVAEYAQLATTPDSCLSIQTCTPTADPGTVSGGTIATANDPCGVIAFQIKQSNNQTITTALGSLDLTGLAPTVQLPILVTTGLGQLTIDGFAPTVSTNTTITIGLGALTLDGFVPSVNITNNTLVTPGVGVLDLTGLAPTVQTPVTITTGLGALTLDGLAPTVQTPVSVTTGSGSLDLTGFAPTVTIEAGGTTVTPATGQLDLTGFAPTVQTPVSVTTGLGQLTIDGFAPVVQTPVIVTVGVGQLDLTGFAPTAQTPKTVTTGVGAITLTGFNPTIAISDNQVILTGVGALTLTGFNPTVTSTNHAVARPAVGALIMEGFAPVVVGTFIPTPDSGTAPSYNEDDEIIALELV